MNIGIITIISKNYGNRLQNFALQYILERETNSGKIKTIPNSKFKILKNVIKLYSNRLRRRPCAWDKFETNIHYTFGECNQLNVAKFDFFIAGSDQIWNPHFYFTSPREFLYFAKKEQKIAYAASIGTSHVPSEFKDKYRSLLNDIPHLSVREKSAVEIVKNITGRNDIHLVLDPTMLLTKAQWEQFISDSPYSTPTKYVAVYCLGKESDTQLTSQLDSLQASGYEIIDILKAERTAPGTIGPKEFVKLIAGANYVLTDSFHATVFSIIFNTPFAVVQRSDGAKSVDMFTRLTSLLDEFNLSERIYQPEEPLTSCDFTAANSILQERQKESLQFLRNALNLSQKEFYENTNKQTTM